MAYPPHAVLQGSPKWGDQIAICWSADEKLVWLSSKRDLLLKDEWFWIDDDIPETDELDELGVDPRRCIKVDPIGAHELVRLQEVLTSKLENKSERVGR